MLQQVRGAVAAPHAAQVLAAAIARNIVFEFPVLTGSEWDEGRRGTPRFLPAGLLRTGGRAELRRPADRHVEGGRLLAGEHHVAVGAGVPGNPGRHLCQQLRRPRPALFPGAGYEQGGAGWSGRVCGTAADPGEREPARQARHLLLLPLLLMFALDGLHLHLLEGEARLRLFPHCGHFPRLVRPPAGLPGCRLALLPHKGLHPHLEQYGMT